MLSVVAQYGVFTQQRLLIIISSYRHIVIWLKSEEKEVQVLLPCCVSILLVILTPMLFVTFAETGQYFVQVHAVLWSSPSWSAKVSTWYLYRKLYLNLSFSMSLSMSYPALSPSFAALGVEIWTLSDTWGQDGTTEGSDRLLRARLPPCPHFLHYCVICPLHIMVSISKAIIMPNIFVTLLIQSLNIGGACRTCLLVSPLNPTVTLSLAPMKLRSTTSAPFSSRNPLKQSIEDSTMPLNMFRRDEDEGTRSNVTISVMDEQLARMEKNNNGYNGSDEKDTSSALLLGSIQFYKNFISPVLPRACRFLPTCSTYGMEAIQQFGPTKGVILTAWRILRCSPFGGRGYDPPVWPPVPYNYRSY